MIRIYAILGLVIASLAGLVYVQHLRASNAALTVKMEGVQHANEILALKIKTDATLKAADDARATKAEADLKSYQEKANAESRALTSPGRLCFDGADTRRVQRLFDNPLR